MRSRSRVRILALLSVGLGAAFACSNGSSSDHVAVAGGVPGVGGAIPNGTGGVGVGGSATGATTGAGGASSASGGMPGSGGAAGPTGGAVGSGGTAGVGGTAGAGGTAASGGSGGARACDPSSAPLVTKLGLETVVTSSELNAFVYAAQAPGSDDWYLVDILGTIRVYSGGKLRPTPFLDVSAEVQDLNFSYDERGLLSIAFPPDYATSGKFYVALVPTSTATADHDLVLEFTRSAADPYVADVSTRKALVDLPPGGTDPTAGQALDLNTIHNGSTVKFGPDGMLYIGMGDGGGQCNSAVVGAPQDISSPYGKILRLDPSAPAPYGAAGNPFASNGDARVWHYGVRNPFRFSFDSATGDFYYGDVGQWSSEEISFAPAGASGLNFGWPAFEGLEQNPQSDCQTSTTLRTGSTHTPPIHTVAHGTASGAGNLVVAIVGGTVYRGSAIPELQGAYLFGEYYAGRVMGALYQCGDKTSPIAPIRKGCDPNFPKDACFVPQGSTPELGELGAIVEGHDGELYLAANNNTLMKIVPLP